MSERKPMNDAIEYLRNIEGYPTDANIKKLPKPLRYFGYFFISFFTLAVLFIIIANLLTYFKGFIQS
ncbi:amino acid transporter [Bacillus sp. 2205SS5-2]|uniref:amino acid transporter n=1 Tax=Bacillus sp. 2205SS5-2 TaxID=3109031 RepID=UPI0030044A1B